MHISNATDQVHELAPPTCVLLLSKNFDPSLFSNVAPSLSMSMSNLYFFELLIFSKAFIYYLSPLFPKNSDYMKWTKYCKSVLIIGS